jgi:hypothetical protein
MGMPDCDMLVSAVAAILCATIAFAAGACAGRMIVYRKISRLLDERDVIAQRILSEIDLA